MRTEMRRLGLIGGTSWHSTIEYYRNINRDVNAYFGDNTNPPLVLFNMNQALIHRYQREDSWGTIADLAIDAGKQLQNAGEIDRIIEAADVVISDRFRIHRCGVTPMETRGAVAQWDERKGLRVWMSTQRPHIDRVVFADLFVRQPDLWNLR